MDYLSTTDESAECIGKKPAQKEVCMIPIRLEVKNFLPYRNPEPLIFEGIHLACLTGLNGAGKSSILDAITWALWGRARGKRDDDLVHLGQNDMAVTLDFWHEGVVYRVLRRRAKGKTSTGDLTLFAQQPEGHFLVMESGLRNAQPRINALLRLDYDTFINSAFLQQGKADSFTTKAPAERKKLLADILGLDQWRDYEEIAKDRATQAKNKKEIFELQIAEIDRELATRPALEQEYAHAEIIHAEATVALENARQRLKEVESTPIDLRNAQNNRLDRDGRLRDYSRQLADVRDRIRANQQKLAEYQDILAMQPTIEAGYHALQQARQADSTLSEKFKQLVTIKDERNQLMTELHTAQLRLEGEIDNLRRRISDLQAVIADDVSSELADLQADYDQLSAQQIELEAIREQLVTNKEDLSKYKTQLEALETEGKELGERIKTLQSSDSATCPLCGQPLTKDHLHDLLGQLNAEIEHKRQQYADIRETLIALDAQNKNHDKTVKSLEKNLKRMPQVTTQLGKLGERKQKADEAHAQLGALIPQLQALEIQLQNDDYAHQARQRLLELDNEQIGLGYDESSHDSARQAIEQHITYEALHTKLAIALDSAPVVAQLIEDGQAQEARLLEAQAQIQAQIDELDIEIARLTALFAEFKAREEEMRVQTTRERNAFEKLNAIRQQLVAMDNALKRRETLIHQLNIAKHDESVYTELRKAFGKDGVPLTIIEAAIPELERSANDLLTRMTDGRMNLRLKTQAEKVTGGSKDVLDIEIADELGERSYEMYSGGESFRINFALRVALSQLLARRAGAQLQTLFIDEGFGTQDENGRAKLVEAITAVQDDFAMVLVITHIDELRDSFPVHIVVEKGAGGSRVMIR
jgi:exonuclease SbcC